MSIGKETLRGETRHYSAPEPQTFPTLVLVLHRRHLKHSLIAQRGRCGLTRDTSGFSRPDMSLRFPSPEIPNSSNVFNRKLEACNQYPISLDCRSLVVELRLSVALVLNQSLQRYRATRYLFPTAGSRVPNPRDPKP